ncbi:hypothetical protein [Streptomyces sp. NPDC004976]
MLGFLSTLPADKRQPNLLFATARHMLSSVHRQAPQRVKAAEPGMDRSLAQRLESLMPAAS